MKRWLESIVVVQQWTKTLPDILTENIFLFDPTKTREKTPQQWCICHNRACRCSHFPPFPLLFMERLMRGIGVVRRRRDGNGFQWYQSLCLPLHWISGAVDVQGISYEEKELLYKWYCIGLFFSRYFTSNYHNYNFNLSLQKLSQAVIIVIISSLVLIYHISMNLYRINLSTSWDY